MRDTDARRRCPACRQSMHALPLPGLHGSAVEVDHCRRCRLVWFDALEPSALAQSAWVALLSALLSDLAAAGPGEVPPLDAAAARCPRCAVALQAQPQVSAFGRSITFACPAGHGQAQRDGALLASRGLFRPLLLDERVLLATERRQLHCLPCGAALTGDSERCAWCESPATVFDLATLSRALGLVDGGERVGDPAPLQPWPCRGCGAPLDVTQHAACSSCGRPVLAAAVGDLTPLLDAARTRLARRSDDATQKALASRRVGQHRRIHELTGRDEHRQALGLLEARFWRRWGWVVALFAVLWLMAWCTSGG